MRKLLRQQAEGKIEKHYQVGDKVWYAHYDTSRIQKPCPVCYGNKEVVLILGNGKKVSLPCDYCGKGFDEPRGYIEEYQYTSKAEFVAISSIESHISMTGKDIKYYSGGRYYSSDDLFDTKEEALARSIEKMKQQEIEENTRAERLKENHYKSYAWNAGYHLRQAAEGRRQAEYHEAKAKLCKDKAKGG